MDFGSEVSFGRVGIRGLGVGISPVVGGRHYLIVGSLIVALLSSSRCR